MPRMWAPDLCRSQEHACAILRNLACSEQWLVGNPAIFISNSGDVKLSLGPVASTSSTCGQAEAHIEEIEGPDLVLSALERFRQAPSVQVRTNGCCGSWMDFGGDCW